MSLFWMRLIEQCSFNAIFFCSLFHAKCWSKTYREGHFSPLLTLHHLRLTADIYFSDILAMFLLNVKTQSNLSHTSHSKFFHSFVIHNKFMSLHLCHFSSRFFFLSKYKVINQSDICNFVIIMKLKSNNFTTIIIKNLFHFAIESMGALQRRAWTRLKSKYLLHLEDYIFFWDIKHQFCYQDNFLLDIWMQTEHED